MNLTEVHDLLTLVASVDNRRFDDTTVAAWHAILGDLPATDAQYAVIEHFKTDREYLMPAHIRNHALAIARERHRIERETVEAEREAIEAAQRGTTTDRTAEVYDLVRQVRDVLPAGRPDKLRYGLGRHRAPRAATAGPNPHFRGWHVPPDLTDPAEHESA